MKTIITIILIVQSLVFAGDTTRQVIRDHYHFSSKGFTQLDAQISYGIGELYLSPSKTRHDIDGFVQYDPRFVTPDIDMKSRRKTAYFSIDIDSRDSSYNLDVHIDHLRDLKGLSRKTRNVLDFTLPATLPTSLDLEFGFGSADIDLSGIRLEDLDIECGLSDVNVSSLRDNPIECNRIKLESGLGDLSISGLGYVHARNIDLNVGLGSANIDFRGGRIIDTEFDIEVGLGDLDLILPERANIRVDINDTFLSSVSVYGLKEENEDEYVSPDWKPGLPVIHLDISVGLGSVDISVKN